MSTRTLLRIALAPAVLATALMSGGFAFAHDEAAMPSGAASVKGEMLMWIEDAQDKLTQLAEAFPEKKYGWSPDKGVRTVGQLFMHVSAANYGIPKFIGIPAPAGFDFGTYEHTLTAKADIVKSLKESFAHMEGSLKSMSDADMDAPAEFFGMKTTKRGAFFLLLSHAHEHLGQAIAYARMNRIVPPWTVKQQAGEAKSPKQ
jgi:uncharacterized damage-inducible protein DinB